MHSLRLFAVAGSVVWPCLAVFSPVAAAEIDEVIVTGSHMPIARDQIGSAYTVITAADIARRQAVRVADVLRGVPGFAVSANGGAGGQVNIRVRGAESNHLLVLIDGIKVNDVAGADQFDFAHLLADNIERIEIVRGPQSALYGSEALAGVIHIITKSGGLTTTLSGSLEKGTDGGVQGGAGLSGGGTGYRYNLHAARLSSSGNNISLTGDEDDGYDNLTASFKIGMQPLSNLHLETVGRHIESDAETDADDFATGLAMDADKNSEVSQNYLGVRAVFDLFDGHWRHQANATLTRVDSDHFDAGLSDGATQGEKLRFDYQSTVHFKTASHWHAAHALTVAVDHEKDGFTQVGDITAFGDPNQKRHATTMGWVAGYQVNLDERLFFSASARRDDHSAFKNAGTYRITAAYRLRGARLHASFGTGVQRPTFYERFGFYTNFRGNPDLRPERSRSWDLGLEQTVGQDRATLGLTYFRARLDNEIETVFGALSTARNDDGISRREGIELAADVRLIDTLRLALTYTWLNATDHDGTQEVRRPRHQASANLHYRLPGDRVSLNLNTDYIGARTDDNFIVGDAELGGDVLLNAVASYQLTKATQIYVKIDNLLDRNYSSIFGYNSPGPYAGIGIKTTFQPQRFRHETR